MKFRCRMIDLTAMREFTSKHLLRFFEFIILYLITIKLHNLERSYYFPSIKANLKKKLESLQFLLLVK